VAPAGISAHRPDARAIADVRSRAADLGMAIAEETGPATAVAHLEALAAGVAPSSSSRR
jgi:hypothetical protein